MVYIDLSKFFSKEDYEIIINIANTISKNNGDLYLVCGSVRDIILGSVPHDYDFCVVGVNANIFENIFPDAINQGKSFPVYILNNHEFALARKESKSGTKHTDFELLVNSKISIFEDLARRDLTVNSIAIHVLTQKIFDPFGGIKDINNKILKMTSTAFSEDPLRVYRVARLSSKLDFEVDPSTLSEMRSMRDELINLSMERVFTEFRKAIATSHPSRFFNVLKECNCLDIHFKEIYNLIGVKQPVLYHPEGDAYNHTLEVLERVSESTTDELTRFSALVHDFGKAATPKENWPHHYDHDKLGVPIIKSFCKRLKMPTVFLKAGSLACSSHMLAGIYPHLKPGTKIDFFEKIYKSKSLSFEGLELIAISDTIKDYTIQFAEIGEDVMKNVNITDEDLSKINQKNNLNKLEKAALIRQHLRDKRIRYLQQLEKNRNGKL